MGIRAHREAGSEAGVSVVETALLLLLIAALAFTAIAFFGSSVRRLFDKTPPAFQPTVSLTSTTAGSSGGSSGGSGGGQGGGPGLECHVTVVHGGGTTSTTEVCVPSH